jgi:hypothetical protein
MYHPDQYEWEQEAAEEERFQERFQEQLRDLSEGPTFAFLARFGDAIQERVDPCKREAQNLVSAGFYGAGLARAAAGIEITVRFFLARPLVQGAFLPDKWAQALANRILNGRAAKDRELLPAILRNWGIDVTSVMLLDGPQLWQTIISRVWPRRNDYLHAGADISASESGVALECLDSVLRDIVEPIAARLGFTRSETGKWSVVLSRFNGDLNPPANYDTDTPFRDVPA